MKKPRHEIKVDDRIKTDVAREREIKIKAKAKLNAEEHREHVLDAMLLISKQLTTVTTNSSRPVNPISYLLVQIEIQLSENPQIDINTIKLFCLAKDNKSILITSLSDYIKLILTNQIDINELQSNYNQTALVCVKTTLEFFLRNPEALKLINRYRNKVYDIYFNKSLAKSRFSNNKQQETLNELIRFFNVINVDHGDIQILKERFNKFNDFEKKSFITALKTHFNSDTFPDPKTIVTELFAEYKKQVKFDEDMTERKEQQQKLQRISSGQPVLAIDLKESIAKRIRKLNPDPKQAQKYERIITYIDKNYSHDQKYKLLDLIIYAEEKSKTKDVLLIIGTYYSDFNDCITRLKRFLENK